MAKVSNKISSGDSTKAHSNSYIKLKSPAILQHDWLKTCEELSTHGTYYLWTLKVFETTKLTHLCLDVIEPEIEAKYVTRDHYETLPKHMGILISSQNHLLYCNKIGSKPVKSFTYKVPTVCGL